MTVIDNRGKPLPKDHPFAGTTLIFGIKPPPNWKKRVQKQKQEAEKKKLESKSEEGQDHAEI